MAQAEEVLDTKHKVCEVLLMLQDTQSLQFTIAICWNM